MDENSLFPPKMREFLKEYLGDKRGILAPVGNILRHPIPSMTVAQTNLELDIQGDFFYVDRLSTGIANVRFNNVSMPALPVARHFSIKGFPFKRVYIDYLSQPGLQINFWYGYGAEIIPFAQDTGSMYLAPAASASSNGIVVSNASVTILGNNPNAKRRVIQNQGATDLFLRFNNQAAVADATSLRVPAGGVWRSGDDSAIHTSQVTGIRAGVDATVSVYWEDANAA